MMVEALILERFLILKITQKKLVARIKNDEQI